ncbi:MAG: HEAT repeat domain-containing protein [Actinobacteria bacterium]|nr:HEAT repeat domain-containing protein [Actinomycetota bacterium]
MAGEKKVVGLNPTLGEVERAAREGDTAVLLKALEDASLEVRNAAVEALGQVGGERAKVALMSVARDRRGERPEVRISALGALEGVHSVERYASILEEFITGDSRKVVAAARRMLESVDPEGYPLRLVERRCLDHAAISVYGRAGVEAAVRLLSGFVTDRMEAGDLTDTGNWGKVYAATRALGRIGGDEAGRTLQALLDWLSSAGGQGGKWLEKERLSKIRDAARASIEKAGKG